MRNKFSQEFKIQAVEKALNRDENTTILEVSDSLGVGHSTLGKWLIKAKKHELNSSNTVGSNKEKRPQDLSLKERFDLVLKCFPLDEPGKNKLCRERGIYPHHITQWEVEVAILIRTHDLKYLKRKKVCLK